MSVKVFTKDFTLNNQDYELDIYRLPSTTTPLNILGVTSSGEEAPNVASNVIDNNPATRWSSNGLGQWIRADLGVVASISEVDISWYLGDQRTSTFTIDVSTDGTTYVNLFTGKSSGTTAGLEKYLQAGAPATGQYIKITVQGNSQNTWASITEVKAFGSGGSPPPPSPTPSPPPSPTPSPPPSPTPSPPPAPTPPPPSPTPSPPPPPPGSNVDQFGVTKIYGDGPGSNYFMTADPSSDPRGNNPEASSSYKPKYIKNSDGSFKIKGQIEIRGAITQNNGYNESKLCTDFTKDVANGYMQDSMDWKDIEMTSYYRINQVGSSSSNGESHIEHVMRGQRSSTSTTTVGVCGCALGCSDNYHANIYCNKGSNGSARQKYEKDLFHTTGYSTDISGVNNNTAYNFKLGQWFGIKTIVYNLPDGSVQLEHWTDENATNTWKKTHSMIDHDQWPPRGAIGHCNLPPSKSGSPPITFGGPLTVFRSDNLEDYDVKFQSIRSIDSTKKLMGEEHNKETDKHEGFAEEIVP